MNSDKYIDTRPKTHPMRAKFRKEKADRLRAMREFERTIRPRLQFVDETAVEMLKAGTHPDEVIAMIEREYLACGIDPDVSPVWQNPYGIAGLV